MSLRRARSVASCAFAISILLLLALTGASLRPEPVIAKGSVVVSDRIIVSGASGQLGRGVVRDLLARGVPAKKLILVSRTPEALQDFAKLGASTRFGDFSKPESLPAAFAGGTKMLLISIGFGGGPRPEAHKHAIDAAVAAGVKQIVYTSWVALSAGDASGIGADHHATEEMLKKSRVHWTLLRNSIYQDVLVGQAAKMVADGMKTKRMTSQALSSSVSARSPLLHRPSAGRISL
jgi:uncharacterized protein YbjT (DUF2867 family)